MADQDPRTIVRTTTRLWSEEVAIARASDPLAAGDPDKEPGYEFSNGVSFNTPRDPYANPAD